MRASPEQLQRELTVRGLGHRHHAQVVCLLQDVLYCLRRILRQSHFKNQDFGGKFLRCSYRLRQGLCLPDHANVIFHSKDLAQPGAKDGLRVGHDHTYELFPVLHLRRGHCHFSRAQPSASHTVLLVWVGHSCPTPLFLLSLLLSFFAFDLAGFLIHYRRSNRYSSITTPTPRRPSCSPLRTTRPRHSTFTSASAPTTSAGSEIVKSMVEPTGISTS